MNDLSNRLIDYGLHLMHQATGTSPGPVADVAWVSAFIERMGGDPGASVPPGPCQTVFTRVKLGAREPANAYWRAMPMALSGDEFLPTSQSDAAHADRNALGERFRAGVADLDRSDPRALTRFYHMMRAYASRLPNSYGEPGVGLFEQWKAIAALACVGRHTDAPPEDVLLISGDIPGIQRAIYTVSSKGAAKTLRGRSFFVQLLGDAAVRRLLDALELCEANVVYDAGGNFLMLARANQAALVEKVGREINERVLEAFDGSLHLALAWHPLETWALFDHSEFPKAREALGQGLASAKARPFGGMIGRWDKLWEPYGSGGMAHCQVTGVDLPDGGVVLGPVGETGQGQVRVSPMVKSLFDLAYHVRHERLQMKLTSEPATLGKTFSYGDGWDDLLAKLCGYRYAFSEMPVRSDRFRPSSDALVFALNEPEAAARGYHGFRFIANVTPYVTGADIAWWIEKAPEEDPPERGDIRSFAMLAHAATEAKAIERVGVLRMDVDNLGHVFAGEETLLTMPLLSELSSALEQFFSGRLNAIVRQVAGNDAYVIYAGGDDLFIVGAWHKLPELAEAIHEIFHAYTGKHPALTISGGITLEQPKFPIYRAATRAAEAEEDAKRHVRYRRFEDGRLKLDSQGERQPAGSKDALCFLGTVVGWEEWPKVKAQQTSLQDLVQPGPNDEKPVPKAIIHMVQKLHRDYIDGLAEARKRFRRRLAATEAEERAKLRRDAPDERQFYGRWRWMQAYAIGRTVERHKDRRTELEDMQRALLMPDSVRLAGLASRWVEYLMRKED